MIAALAKLHDDAKHRKHIARLQIFPCTIKKVSNFT